MKRRIGKKLAALLAIALVLQGIPDIHPGGMTTTIINEVYAAEGDEGGSGTGTTTSGTGDSTGTGSDWSEAKVDFYIEYGSDNEKYPTDRTIELKNVFLKTDQRKGEATLSIQPTAGKWVDGSKIEWTVEPLNETEVIKIKSIDEKYGDIVRLDVLNIGYAKLHANILHNGDRYQRTFTVYVPLELRTDGKNQVNYEIDKTKPGNKYGKSDAFEYGGNETILLSAAENLGSKYYLLMFRYVNYNNGVNSAVSPSAEIVTDASQPKWEWKTNPSYIVDVDKNGLITALCAGYTELTVKPEVGENDSYTIDVIVDAAVDCSSITGAESIEKADGSTLNDLWQNDIIITANKPEITFKINTEMPTDLYWSIYDKNDTSGDRLKTKEDSNKQSVEFQFSDSLIKGQVQKDTVQLRNLKAGTYEFVVWPKATSTNINEAEQNPYRNKLKIKIIVPPMVSEEEIVMNVDDYYHLLQNVNLDTDLFKWQLLDENGEDVTFNSNKRIAKFETDRNKVKGLTAIRAGRQTIVLTYQGDPNLPHPDKEEFRIPIIVIDKLVFFEDTVEMYEGDTHPLQLKTYSTIPIDWVIEPKQQNVISLTLSQEGSFDDPRIVEITAKEPGTVTVTAIQVINGVEKRATCTVTVKPKPIAVTSITLEAQKNTLEVGEFTLIKATVKPQLNENSELQWVSSDPSIVSIDDDNDPENKKPLQKTVTAKAVGTAVIYVIDKDSVVVGSCLITVTPPKAWISSITISQTSIIRSPSKDSFILYANISPKEAQKEEVSWSSSDTSVAVIDEKTGMVTLTGKPGTTEIDCVGIGENGKIIRAKKRCIIKILNPVPVTGIKLDRSTVSMLVGESLKLDYTLTPATPDNPSLTWTSTNSSVVTVDKNGVLRARGVGQSSVIVRTVDGGYIATCTVTVERSATGVKLDVKSLTLNTGDYYYLQSTITPADSTDVTLIWQSSDAQVAVVSNTGKVMAKRPGIAIISVQTRSGSTAYCNITVQQGVTGVELDTNEETIFIGDEFEIMRDVLPRNATKTDVKWTSSMPSVARVTTDKRTGDATVKGVSEGVAIITCTTVDGGYVDYCVVIVEKPDVEVSGLTVEPTSLQLGVGKTSKLTATVTPSDATDKGVIWSSSNSRVVTVDEKGRIRGVKVGTATITCEAADGSGAEAYCEVEVCYEITDINLNTEYLDMVVGDSATLSATVSPKNATYGVHWESKDPTVALVNRTTGKVTAVKAGDTIITAYADDNSGMTAICYVHVKNPVATTNIQVSESEIVMIPGESKTVSFTILPANHTDGYVWSSDNPVVVDVNTRTGVITARSMGTANITIFADSGRTASVKVYVVGLSKSALALQQYSSTIISLEVYGSSKSDLDIKWYSDNERVAEVAGGRITARAIGTTTVYAVVNGRTLPCRVTVEKIRSGS